MDVGFKKPGIPKPKEPQKFSEGQGSQIRLENVTPSTITTAEPENEKEALPMLPPMNPPPPPPAPIGSNSPTDIKSREQRFAEKQAKYAEILASLKYEPPPNGSPIADPMYRFEVLKTGTIVDKVNFRKEDKKGFYVVGRVPACDVVAENPTVSRTHAILQFIRCPDGQQAKSGEAGDDSETGEPRQTGLYVYDLNSTHGTFINKNQVFPNKFYRLRVGHVLKFGNSARLYVLLGPSEDEEEESDKSVTELQNEKLQRELERKRLVEQGILAKSEGEEGGDDGCSWGMGDDADEESDLRENPFAINFEESESFDNPKKTLRGWFEREDYELVYDCREKAPGQFICRINLPLDGPTGTPVFAEVDLKGKKREAVHQAALQACQILDKYGVLRQSHVESKASKGKRKKTLEDQDYYSSDEDTFLDRTGYVEKKRDKRMKIAGNAEEKPETFESLNEQAAAVQKEINTLQVQIKKAQSLSADGDDIDVDDYMKYLKTGASDVKKLKSKLLEANEEINRINKLLRIVKPAVIPIKCSTENAGFIKKEIKTEKINSEVKKQSSLTGDVVPKPNQYSNICSSIDKSNESTQPKLFSPRLLDTTPTNEIIFPQETVTLDVPNTLPIVITPEDSEQREILPQNITTVKLKNDFKNSHSEGEDEHEVLGEPSKKKQKRNRLRQKANKDDKYDYDALDPKYSTWTPPKDQQGDGRTSLNEKLGY